MSQDSSIRRILYEDLFAGMRPKGRARAESIILATIENYATIGVENTTFDKIAATGKISRPLIFKYFQNYDELFYKTIKYIRVHFQGAAVSAIQQHQRADLMLEAYVISTFDWIRDYPKFINTWIFYLAHCTHNERDRDLNTQFVEIGRQRIASLLRLGNEQNVFQCADPEVAAKTIQTLITGALITCVTENIAHKIPDYKNETTRECLRQAGLISPRTKADRNK